MKIWFQNRRTKWKKENPSEQHHQTSMNSRKQLNTQEQPILSGGLGSNHSDASDMSPPNSSITESPPARDQREDGTNAVLLAYVFNQLRNSLHKDKNATTDGILQAFANNVTATSSRPLKGEGDQVGLDTGSWKADTVNSALVHISRDCSCSNSFSRWGIMWLLVTYWKHIWQ